MNPQEIKKAQKTLQLPEETTPAEIKKQYHKLTKKHHPDQGNKNQKRMQEINQAYQTLQEYIQNYLINLNPQETKTTHQKHMESFTHDWMWTPGKKQKK
ncbi:MAG: heat-shock protein [Candidatus Altiarchaeales archaeon ex4484_2]|nr:MAG: heat-shock protein [Candidatus Altiarchaeales archaeon ex4484_2]